MDLLNVYLTHPLENVAVLHHMRFLEISFENSQLAESSGKLLAELVNLVVDAVKDKHQTKIRLFLQILCGALNSTNFHDKAQIWPTVLELPKSKLTKHVQINLDPKILARLGKMEELDSLLTKFQAIVLVHGPSSNFANCM